MSRLLTLLLLYKNGYSVGKYISIERQIEKTKDRYYDVLETSDIGWHEKKTIPHHLYVICLRSFGLVTPDLKNV